MTVLRPETRFLAPMTSDLGPLGLVGREVAVALRPDGIALTGAQSGAVVLPFTGITRMRFGFTEPLRRAPKLTVWRAGTQRPLVFVGDGDRPDYAIFARQTAAQVLSDRTPVILETGAGLFLPVLVLAALSLVALGLAVYAIVLATKGEPDWKPVPALSIAVILLPFLGSWLFRRSVTRRVERIEDIERALPFARPASPNP